MAKPLTIQYKASELTSELNFGGSLDKEQEMCIELTEHSRFWNIHSINVMFWINEDNAQAIVDHLQKVFNLD